MRPQSELVKKMGNGMKKGELYKTVKVDSELFELRKWRVGTINFMVAVNESDEFAFEPVEASDEVLEDAKKQLGIKPDEFLASALVYELQRNS
jgi:DNA/RNA endonuclease YhcR with UshA esterase domain